MDSRHKTKAITGAVIWFASIPVAFITPVGLEMISHQSNAIAPDHVLPVIFISLLLTQYLMFFWGGNHLAKAKGYSNALLIPGIFWPAQPVILVLLLFALPDKCSRSSNQARKKKHHHDESPIGRVVRYRRNAFAANLFGVIGIFLALFLVFVPTVFATRDNACVAAIFVFLPSYAAVIYGCGYWVKAKNWHEAVVFIGLMPLAVLCIKWVRLIYVAVPMLLPVSMVMMPLILLVVVAVLPDKSGMPRRRR